jgi:cytochrome c oxidase cbb3-type subunit 1
MWRAVNEDGTLTYSFVESVKATFPYYVIRLTGGAMYLSGMLVMAYNVAKTLMGAKPANNTIPAVPAAAHA